MQETTWSDTRIVVKMLCQERKITLRKLASTLGCKPRALNELLDCDPRGHLLEQIADVIGVTAEDITEICRLMKLEPAYAAPAGKHQEGE
ncbi:MAG: helix-turn-helix transcriptional regulator [Mixta calida]|uniref:helix-turn-helix domain-containing protein n=1 Tax=Mixta calida TaxID=665913 RepID=UPI00290E71E2|nr:helix-turn-helix transcriptional regulator [Mixta calida]MDU4943861.1 helix-turn-helix transcriptional regulator [Mixta calida]